MVKRWRGKWVADFTLPDGKRVRRVSPVQTRRGAEEYETRLRTEALTGAGPAPNVSSTSTPSSAARSGAFDEFAVEWLRTYALTNNRPSEVGAKESILRVHLIPFFDNQTLTSIGARDIEQYKAAKLTGGEEGQRLSRKTLNNHLAVLRKLLVTALEWDVIDRVPVIKRVMVPPAKFDWLTAEESDRFLAAVEAHYTRWSTVFWVALRTGMRRGEIFALHWSDADFTAGQITVRRSVYRGKLVPPKGGRERTIPMTSRLASILKAHRLATFMKGDLVFPAQDGGLCTHQDHVDRPLHGALKRAGLRRIRFHDLRHSFASQLVSVGRSLKEVQELLGHQSIQMTMRYAHLAPGRMRDAVEALEQGRVAVAAR